MNAKDARRKAIVRGAVLAAVVWAFALGGCASDPAPSSSGTGYRTGEGNRSIEGSGYRGR